jgi:hypothetical protein
MPVEPWFWTDSRRCHFLVSPNICCGKPASDPVHESARPTEPNDYAACSVCCGWCDVHIQKAVDCKPTSAIDEYAVLDTGGVSEDAVDVAARAGQADTPCADCLGTNGKHDANCSSCPRCGGLAGFHAKRDCLPAATEPQEPGEGA